MSDDTNTPVDPDMTPDEGNQPVGGGAESTPAPDSPVSPDLEGDSLYEGGQTPGEQTLDQPEGQ